jgi:4-amino-4-deoxy-L-arabinose transferase-like glycosyltransferase
MSTVARDRLVALALFAGYATWLVFTGDELGMSRDESFYVHAARSYAGYFEAVAADPSKVFDRETIDRAYVANHEHPVLMKNLFALSYLAHERWGLFETETLAHRFPAMLVASALVALTFWMGRAWFGFGVGLFAAIAFATLPRVFYHSHLNCFDVPIVFFVTWTAYAYHRSLTSKRWAVATGLIFGLALATKHNSWGLPVVFAIHFAWMTAAETRRRREGNAPSVDRRPLGILAMLTLGPLVFFAHWPWLWHDTLARIGGYVGFHLFHEYYNIVYFGVNQFSPPFPVAYPFVMTLFTVPLTVVVLALLGLLRRTPAFFSDAVRVRIFPGSSVARDPRCTDVLLFGLFAAPLVIIALPSTPIFGGTKHWMTAYPFMALYAGVGAALAVSVARELVVRSRGLGVAAYALMLAPGFVETVKSHPYGLAHYTFGAGGTPGAAVHGMNRQFWGYTTAQVVPFLVEQMPDGGRVFLCDTTFLAWEMLVRDGRVPANIQPARTMATADFILVHHEHHFAEVDFQAWIVTGSVAPVHVSTHEGVPIISVYDNRAAKRGGRAAERTTRMR